LTQTLFSQYFTPTASPRPSPDDKMPADVFHAAIDHPLPQRGDSSLHAQRLSALSLPNIRVLTVASQADDLHCVSYHPRMTH
jgi:hypothetical protein